MRHILVVANETVEGEALLARIRERSEDADVRFTVIAPINDPREGYVVYEDTRRASAGRRMEKSIRGLREAGVAVHGLVVSEEPVSAVRDALATLQPPVDEIIVSTHPESSSGWQRRDVIAEIRRLAGEIPVDHVVVDQRGEASDQTNVLVLANETVVGPALLDKIRERATQGKAAFLIISPQEAAAGAHPEAEKRLRIALITLRSEGLAVHGQIAHPDPFTAAMHAVHDEKIDEIIVSTFGASRSGWLRRDLVERLRKETGLPVEHVVAEQPVAVGS